MKLFHGTANYNLSGFITSGVNLHVRRDYDKPSFCTSFSFQEAAYFAFRKTPIDDIKFKNCGIVLEFVTGSRIKEGKDFTYYVDTRAIRNEREVIIFNRTIIKLIAYWKYENDNWERISLMPKEQNDERSVATEADQGTEAGPKKI